MLTCCALSDLDQHQVTVWEAMSSTANLCDMACTWELDAVARLMELMHEALGKQFVVELAAALMSDVGPEAVCSRAKSTR